MTERVSVEDVYQHLAEEGPKTYKQLMGALDVPYKNRVKARIRHLKKRGRVEVAETDNHGKHWRAVEEEEQ